MVGAVEPTPKSVGVFNGSVFLTLFYCNTTLFARIRLVLYDYF